MNPKTEQLLATLELLTEPSLMFDLPGHEDGGYIVPFVWDVSEQGEFNVMNLSRAEGWLQLIDIDTLIEIWQDYLVFFPDLSLSYDDKVTRRNNFKLFFQLLTENLEELEYFKVRADSPRFVPNPSVGVVVGRTKDGDWIGVCPTVYTQTQIPREQIDRSPLPEALSHKRLGNNTLNLIWKLEEIISELGIIDLSGDFGGGYDYAYKHRIIYTTAQRKELVFERILQLSGVLEINQFQAFYPDNRYFEDWHDNKDGLYHKYQDINRFLKHSFEKILMYRFSFWTLEYIYIIGQTQLGNKAGLHLASEFVYNP